MNKRKICIVTGTRAEYGLLQWLMHDISCEEDLQLQIIVTGMHLSPEFGLTYKLIENDGFKIDKKVEMILSSDTPNSIVKSVGLAQIGFADALEDLMPDVLLILGDRYEIFAAASAAMIYRIPVAHIHGGEKTEGAMDEAFRHCLTKMSHLHFTATEEYRKRVIQLGEQPESVYNFGGLGVDTISRLDLLSKDDLQRKMNFTFNDRTVLVTFHPVTLETRTSAEQFKELLKALDSIDCLKIIFTKANSDTDGRIINQLIDEYSKGKDHVITFTSMGQLNYLSALQYVRVVVGNSSSGLLEAPTFKVGTVNIGERQKGRIKSDSIIDCIPEKDSIIKSINQCLSDEFQDSLKDLINPYGDGGASAQIINVLKNVDLSMKIKKVFYDLP